MCTYPPTEAQRSYLTVLERDRVHPENYDTIFHWCKCGVSAAIGALLQQRPVNPTTPTASKPVSAVATLEDG